MTPERYQRIGQIFNEALERSPDDRSLWLKQVCYDDPGLLAEVECLLANHSDSEQFLARPAFDVAAQLIQPAPFPTNQTYGHYRILSQLGKGGMGEVYLAEDTHLRRKVALKLLPATVAESPDRLRRFEQEAFAASALNHPNILTIYEFSVEGNTHLLVSEFIDGETLRARMNRSALSINEAIDIALQTAQALVAAHDARIIHRDIKPENLMLRKDGIVKVLDFGLAKLTPSQSLDYGMRNEDAETLLQSASSNPHSPIPHPHLTTPGMVIGTVAYMSPEQARGLVVDARTDIWSLGVVLYEMLTGQRPFLGETRADVIAALLSSEPPQISSYRNEIPLELECVVTKALCKDVGARYQTTKDLRADLEKIKKRIEFDESFNQSTGKIEPPNITQENRAQQTIPTNITSVIRQALTNRFRYLMYTLGLMVLIASATYFALRSPTSEQGIDSIAVLPFEYENGSRDLTFVAEGLSEALIDRLAQLPQLKVVSRSSSFAFRGANLNLNDVAKRLGVRAIVMGRVTRINDELNVKVDVVDAVENTQLTGVQFRRRDDDLVSVQSEVAQMVMEKLRLKMTSAQSKRLSENATNNSEAYRYYLSGLVELNGPLDIRSQALEYFEKAVSLDPEFAAAHTEIAWVYWSQANNRSDPQTLIPKVKAATERALHLDPESAKAHVLKALLNEYEFNWQAAESEYKQAIELSPNLDFARINYASYLSVMGRYEEALFELEQQRVRDPINQRLGLLQKGLVLTYARKFDDALNAYQEAQSIEPSRNIPYFSLGYAYGGKGLLNEAVTNYKKSISLLGGEDKYSQPLVFLAATYARIPEKRTEAQAILHKIELMIDYHSPALLATVYSALDDNKRAMELLEQAFIKRDPLLRFLGVGYEYDGLRNDPAFRDLVKRIGISR